MKKSPSLRPRPDGGSVVTLSGQDHYCGRFGSREAEVRYHELVARWIAVGRRPIKPIRSRDEIRVSDLCSRYLDHVSRVHRKRGRETGHVRRVRTAMQTLGNLYGSKPLAEFGRSDLLVVRSAWLMNGRQLTRKTINQYADAVKSAFAWGAEEGIVPALVLAEVRTVRGLRRGRTEAKDRPPVAPVLDDQIEALRSQVRPPVRAMIDLQLLTGMRPGEVVAIRPRDVDRSCTIWRYSVAPEVNKTEHHGRARVVAIGPRAQAILGPWLDRCGPGETPWRTRHGRPFTVDSYYSAVLSACEYLGIPPWSPNRLRHNHATLVRQRFGLDAAQVVLGHAHADTTAIYAETNWGRAAEVAEMIG